MLFRTSVGVTEQISRIDKKNNKMKNLRMFANAALTLVCCLHGAMARPQLVPEFRDDGVTISVIYYYSVNNHTKVLAESIGDGARLLNNTMVHVVSIADADIQTHILDADAVFIGAPVHFGNVASPFLLWVEETWAPHWLNHDFAGKLGGVFATGGGISQGIEHVLTSLQRTLNSYSFQVVIPDPTISAYTSYGVMAATKTPPFNLTAPGVAQCFLDTGKAYGQQVANLAVAHKMVNAYLSH